MFYNQSISNPKLSSIRITYDHASSGAATCWRLTIISCTAALAAMNEKVSSSTNLFRALRIQVEWARPLGCLVHYVFAISKLINGGNDWSDGFRTLHIWVQIALSLSRIPKGINFEFPTSSDKPPSFLIIRVCHWRPIWKGTTTVKAAVRCFYFFLHNLADL